MSKQKEIAALFQEWNDALKTLQPPKVVSLYDVDAVLLPTISNRVRHNHEEIIDYFEGFLAKKPVGEIDESNIRVHGNIAINSGVYTFTFADGVKVPARFTFVYRWNEERWLIIEHHSSQMPEPPA